jgi:hypothetical protein
VPFTNPTDLTDDDLAAIVAAVARGHARVTALDKDPAALSALVSDARLSEWRRAALPWMVTNEPGAIDTLFSLGEFFWLGLDASAAGEPAGAAVKHLDAWGPSVLPAAGGLRVEFPRFEPWEDFSGRDSTGVVVSRIPDLKLRIAQTLVEFKLPAAIARAVLACATQDFLDESSPLRFDDWPTLVYHARTLSRDQLSDAIASLTAGGPLVPVAHAPDPHR